MNFYVLPKGCSNGNADFVEIKESDFINFRRGIGDLVYLLNLKVGQNI